MRGLLTRLKGKKGCFIIIDDDLHSLELEREVRQLGVLYYTAKPPEHSELVRLFSMVFLREEDPWAVRCPP